jgi:hypothetical protein
LFPDSAEISPGETIDYTAVPYNVRNGTIDRVNFSSSNTSVATVNPSSDSTASYTTKATGVSEGTTTIRSDVVMSGSVRCSDTATLNVNPNVDAWWQSIDGDISTNGNLRTEIPSSCTPPSCQPYLSLEGEGGYPGVPSYAGVANFGDGDVSLTNWLAQTRTRYKRTYNYAFFEKLIPSDVPLNEITDSTVNGGYFVSGGTSYRGYVWYHYSGPLDLTINSNINLPGDRKVILLVEDANLNIQGRINLVKGRGFFMAIVEGDTRVDSSVAHPTQTELEGIFFSEGTFYTGAGTEQLAIRGSVVALDGILFQRNLNNNSQTPAEVFEYAPDLILTFPRELTKGRIKWKERAP